MDLTISRRDDNLELSIYRNPIETGTVIHNNSDHPYEQKMAAFTYYINRLLTLPITEASKRSEWTTMDFTHNRSIKTIGMDNSGQQ